MHPVGFIIRIYHDARSSECQIRHSVDIYSFFFMISSSNIFLFIRSLLKWMKTSRSLYIREVVSRPSACLSVLSQVL